MAGIQVGLILGAVQPEADGPVSLGAVKVVDEQGLYLLGHGCSVSLPDLAYQACHPGRASCAAAPMCPATAGRY
jgi:hypothetical protein